MWMQVTRVIGFFPANFHLAMPFLSQLKVRHETDRRTDIDHQCLMLLPSGSGGITLITDDRNNDIKLF